MILPLFYLLGKAFGARGIWISFSLQFVIVVSYVIIVALIMGRKNKIVAGMNDEDMALAANTLIECGGGLCAVADGTLLALVHLPIAGLMNDVSAEQMDGLLRKLGDAWKEMGCTIHSPFMTMAYISLACIPELRLTNRGLVDCRTFRSVNAFIKEET